MAIKKNIYSSFWLDIDSYSDNDQVTKLGIIQKTITNFVNLLTNKSIECTFLENTSNTKHSKNKNTKHGQSTSDKILISADLDNIDLVVGLALHEATHIVKTDFTYQTKLPTEIVDYIFNLSIDHRVIFNNLFHVLVNFIEDRICDDYQLKNSPGYYGYYKVLYEDTFLSDEITSALKLNESKQEHINNYIFRIINMFNSAAEENALLGMKEILSIIDIENISRLNSTHDSVKVAWSIFNVLLNYCNVFDFSFQSDDIGNVTKRQFKTILHQFEKKKINSSTKQAVDNIINSKIEKVSCIVGVNEIHTIVFEDLKFNKIEVKTLANSKNLKSIADATLLGNKLKNKLQLRNEVKEIVFNKKDKGLLDKKQLFSCTFNDHVFYNKQIEKVDDAYIHFSIDSSSSMVNCWDKVIKILISLIISFKEYSNIKVAISFRTSFLYKNNETPVVYIVYNSEKSNFSIFKTFLKFYVPRGLTPDGICFNSILKKIENESKNKKSYFINISDGAPYFVNNQTKFNYCDELAFEHTRLEVNKIKNANVKVISFYVGPKSNNVETTFKKIYGTNSLIMPNLENPNKIIDLVNSLFI